MRHFRPHDWREYPDLFLLEERKLNFEQSRLECRRIIFKNHERKEYFHSLRLFTLAELLELFTQARLNVLGYYGSLKAEPWSFDSNRLVILVKRAKEVQEAKPGDKVAIKVVAYGSIRGSVSAGASYHEAQTH